MKFPDAGCIQSISSKIESCLSPVIVAHTEQAYNLAAGVECPLPIPYSLSVNQDDVLENNGWKSKQHNYAFN